MGSGRRGKKNKALIIPVARVRPLKPNSAAAMKGCGWRIERAEKKSAEKRVSVYPTHRKMPLGLIMCRIADTLAVLSELVALKEAL